MVGFGLGLFTRLAGPCAALYHLIATIAGGSMPRALPALSLRARSRPAR